MCETIKVEACADAESVINDISQDITCNYSNDFEDFGEVFYDEAMAHYDSLQEKLEEAIDAWLAEQCFDLGYVINHIELIDA